MGFTYRFYSKVSHYDGGCWIWGDCKDPAGYGRFWVGVNRRDGRMELAHRVSAMLSGIDVSGDSIVMHSCDNPSCVNPAHLSVGTHKDNAADRESKGRGWDGRGLRERDEAGRWV